MTSKAIARCLFAVVFGCLNFTGHSQTLSVAVTIKSYSADQKRFLAINTAQFINFITQGSLDKDSVMAIACRITGTSFLLPYNEELYSKGPDEGADLINAGKIAEAKQLFKTLEGEKRLQLLYELAVYYLHQIGTKKSDLDSANYYIREALALTEMLKNSNWKYRCLNLFGDYHYQKGDVPESKKFFLQVISSTETGSDAVTKAKAWKGLAICADNDSLKVSCLNNSLLIYQQLQMKEKEMELLGEISIPDIVKAEKTLLRVLMLQQSTGYKHSLYTEYALSYTNLVHTNYLEAMKYANAALDNLRWSGISGISAAFFNRLATSYWFVGKKEEALSWFKKGLETRHKETQLFWYKSLLFAVTLLSDMNRPQEALTLLYEVTKDYPPITQWEKFQVISLEGFCHEKLSQPGLADENYTALLELNNGVPLINFELAETYWLIADFYVSRANIKKARMFMNLASAGNSQLYPDDLVAKNHLLFRIDSLQGNYKSAMEHYMQYKIYYDTIAGMDQRKKFDELTVKYDAEKKDQDIKLLKEKEAVQRIEAKQNKLTRNIMIAAASLLLIIAGLLFNQFKVKQQTNKQINKNNAALTQMVAEKEWLVKEIHHRVKNNFQMVMGLLGTQSGYLKNDVAKNAISDSQRRINAMSLIHQKLYQTENLSAISMPDYIRELVHFLKSSLNIGNRIRFDLYIDPVELDLAHCVPLALILNESISNSFKYAFPNEAGGLISISLKHTSSDQLLLVVKDDGTGLPHDFNLLKQHSMGMNLMRGLCQEIGGRFIISGTNGTTIEIAFAYDSEAIGKAAHLKTASTQPV